MTHALTLANFSVPSSAGSLEDYIQAAQRVPMLSETEEQELARNFRQENDLEAARKLVLSHLRLVIAIARGYQGYGLPQADLIQEGNVGLMKAVKRFDPTRGVRLVSFAMHWIKAEIHEYILRNWRLVKIATTKAQRKLFFNLRSLKQSLTTLGQEQVNAVAAQLGVKPEEVVEMETRFSGGDVALESGSDDEDEHFAPIAYLAADSSVEPSMQLERKEYDRLQDEGLRSALAGLDERSRAIVQRRWLVEEGSEAATLHELAAEFGVSAERIRQIEVKAMQKMKALLVSQT
ncbi:RNA polymerase sigma factor RpoH [Denitratisoma oestradiolicum]|uniref:RNA polymerase sigma factor RpoH n=1 Tax=Denitratisoma oestradiolicum TaxID=311182 RepID=A0A6S6XX84_9PROT|nr:RNA polymerase sigma factor RpoH [Denitratisoma oestradiolicum]TWO79701.1 RNA polymerase factor sigma-32 [Denitratisoma oestradiolicum]CAB1367459.1 RNA polymerase, sigma 32 (sigma H) factor [Denitratisoma oestradiolicum]